MIRCGREREREREPWVAETALYCTLGRQGSTARVSRQEDAALGGQRAGRAGVDAVTAGVRPRSRVVWQCMRGGVGKARHAREV